MDTFGALALATEAPTADLLERKPYGRNERLVNGYMWRNIMVQVSMRLVSVWTHMCLSVCLCLCEGGGG
jgi:hypothetical protein